MNRNPETGIAFGYIRADAIYPELLDQLTIHNGTNVSYNEALAEHHAEARRKHEANMEEKRIARAELDGGTLSEDEDLDFDEDAATEEFGNSYQGDEEVYEGEKDGVKYRTSWLGGAMHLWVFESPVVVKCAVCSPCVPGAGDLDNFGSYEAYGLPVDWLDEDFLRERCKDAGYAPFEYRLDALHQFRWGYGSQSEEANLTGGFTTECEALEACYTKNIVVNKEVSDDN